MKLYTSLAMAFFLFIITAIVASFVLLGTGRLGLYCTLDCSNACDPNSQCCFKDTCIPGKCGGLAGAKDIEDYTAEGFVKYKPGEVDWPQCPGDLKDYEISDSGG